MTQRKPRIDEPQGPPTDELEKALDALVNAARGYAADWLESFARGIRGED